MPKHKTSPHLCWVCGDDVPLEKSKTDEYGNPVHEDCYLFRISRATGKKKIEFLSGWKEIANCLRVGVRTVQRYERTLGLPICRPAGKSKGSVIATKASLARWMSGKPVRVDTAIDSRVEYDRANRLRADFLIIDSEIGLTFSRMAFDAACPEKRKRTAHAARQAYDTILRLLEDVDFVAADRNTLNVNLDRLKTELQNLGEQF